VWLVYDEAKGLPEEGIIPATRLQDLPKSWVCPKCGVTKADEGYRVWLF